MAALPVTCFAGEKVAVLGLGKSGIVAAESLRAGGALVEAWDDEERTRARAAAEGIPVRDLAATDWSGMRALVISPGIPHTHPAPHPVAKIAKTNGVAIIGDIELLARSVGAGRWIGITGTNGKSTTTALVGHVLSAAGREAQVGGNIGIPALQLPRISPDGIYVLEMSSYQLEITHAIAFDVALLLNVTPDHLDRHGGMDGYVAAKRLIFRGQRPGQTAIVGVDDEICAGIHAELARENGRRVIAISAATRLDTGVSAAGGHLVDAIDGTPRIVADLRAIPTLPGQHNWQNAAATYAACRAAGIPSARRSSRRSRPIPGLPHRQEKVGEIAGVVFVNDSKATNADSAAKALGCYDAIWWIAGGLAKEGGIAPLATFFPRIRKAYLIGAAAPEFARTLTRGGVAHETTETLERAVAAAARDAAAPATPGASCCCRPPARPSTSSPISRCAARASAAWSSSSRRRGRRHDPGLRARRQLAPRPLVVDRRPLVAGGPGALIAVGAVLAMAATPPVAEKLGLEPFYFVRRQFALLPIAIGIILAVSLLDLSGVRRAAAIMLVVSIALLVFTLIAGVEIKGARRWINLPGLLAAALGVREAELRRRSPPGCSRCSAGGSACPAT
jgi:UDP-N-acetylmuramoylalanine--D-glutamate ligase